MGIPLMKGFDNRDRVIHIVTLSSHEMATAQIEPLNLG
jgi:hypothetical protein